MAREAMKVRWGGGYSAGVGVGAGVGALPVCVDAARRFSIPLLDAGHVLDIMNAPDGKSSRVRLYTIRKPG